jgi:hypothetical protein
MIVFATRVAGNLLTQKTVQDSFSSLSSRKNGKIFRDGFSLPNSEYCLLTYTIVVSGNTESSDESEKSELLDIVSKYCVVK